MNSNLQALCLDHNKMIDLDQEVKEIGSFFELLFCYYIGKKEETLIEDKYLIIFTSNYQKAYMFKSSKELIEWMQSKTNNQFIKIKNQRTGNIWTNHWLINKIPKSCKECLSKIHDTNHNFGYDCFINPQDMVLTKESEANVPKNEMKINNFGLLRYKDSPEIKEQLSNYDYFLKFQLKPFTNTLTINALFFNKLLKIAKDDEHTVSLETINGRISYNYTIRETKESFLKKVNTILKKRVILNEL